MDLGEKHCFSYNDKQLVIVIGYNHLVKNKRVTNMDK